MKTPQYTIMRRAVEAYYDIQKIRIIQSQRIQDLERRGELTKPQARTLHDYTDVKLFNHEKELNNYIKKLVSTETVWNKWLKDVNGIGHILAAGLMSYVEDIEKFQTISQLWSYSGLGLVSRCSKCDKRLFTDEIYKQKWINKMIDRFENARNTKGKKHISKDGPWKYSVKHGKKDSIKEIKTAINQSIKEFKKLFPRYSKWGINQLATIEDKAVFEIAKTSKKNKDKGTITIRISVLKTVTRVSGHGYNNEEARLLEKRLYHGIRNRFKKYDKVTKKANKEIIKKVDELICNCKNPIEIRVIAKKKSGELGEWNPRLKQHQWKIGESFIKVKGFYRSLYDRFKKQELKKAKDLPKAQIHARAKRKTVKIFLSHFWHVCRTLKNLDTRGPYAAKAGHKDIIPPMVDGPDGEFAVWNEP